MATDDDAPGDGHVPLPPEHPLPEPHMDAGDTPPADTAAAREPVAPLPEPEPAVDVPHSRRPAEESDDAAPDTEWWRKLDGPGVDGLREDPEDRPDHTAFAAHMLGAQIENAAGHISDAVAATAYPAASKRGLDIRWMRLSLNAPAALLALLVTWGGRTATDRMIQVVVEDGPFAPLGWAVFAVLVVGVFLVLPIGTPLAQALAHVFQALGQGLVTAVRRGWQTPVIGYLMRLVCAVFVWAFAFAVIRVAGRGIIHWLTGA